MKYIAQGVLFIAFTMLVGCASSGRMASTHLTNVEISENNYRVIAKNVSGEAAAGYLLGFSGAAGGEMTTIALVPLKKDRMLYKRALDNLWQNFEQNHGAVENRSLALINVRFDADALNIIGLYTRPKISVRADVIEYIE